MRLVNTTESRTPLLHRVGSRVGNRPRTVLTAPAPRGRWTWTHGGGPGSDPLPVRRTTRPGRPRPCAAGPVRTPGAARAPEGVRTPGGVRASGGAGAFGAVRPLEGRGASEAVRSPGPAATCGAALGRVSRADA